SSVDALTVWKVDVMVSKENVTGLKTLVFSLGMLLIGGILLFGFLLWEKKAQNTSGRCPGGEVDLKGRGAVIDSSLDGRTLRLTLEPQEHTQEIIMLDVCSGKITGKLKILVDVPLIQ